MKKPMLPFLVVLFPLLGSVAHAADWPQWRGPNRNDISTETGLLKSWPKEGPALVWTCEEAGVGYSGPAVVGDRIYGMGAFEKQEMVYALDVRTGKKVWSSEIGTLLTNGYGNGPRGTPTVDGNFLYCISGQGDLTCLEIEKGSKKWSVSFTRDLGGRRPNWGYTESPLIDGDVVVCTPGGDKGALAALEKKSGKVIWRSVDAKTAAAYSSVVIGEAAGVKQYAQMSPGGVFGVAAKDGKLLWRSTIGSNGTAVIPTPIFHKDYVYATSGYGSGCGLLRLVPEGSEVKAERVYGNKVMVNQHGGTILIGDYIYGYSDGKGWVCQNFKTGDSKWEEKKRLGKGSVTCADGQLYCYSENDGTVVLIDASPDGWKENGRFKIPRETKVARQKGRIWTHPVVANGRLYLRDQDLIFAFNINTGGAGGQ